MNMKVKTTFIIIITLILGVVIGAMLNRALLQNRIRRTFSQQNPNRLALFYERIIQPDPAQSEVLREILNKHSKRMSEIRTNFFEEMQSAVKALQADIDPILTLEQKKRLRERMMRPRRFFNQRGRFPPRKGKKAEKNQREI